MGAWKSLLNKKEEEKKEEEKETRGQESVTDIDIRAMETCLAGIWFCARKIAETNGSINIPVSSRRKGQSGKDHSTFQVRLERNCWPERSSVSGAAGGRGTKKSVDAGERSRRRRLSFFFLFSRCNSIAAWEHRIFIFPSRFSIPRERWKRWMASFVILQVRINSRFYNF